MNKVSQQMSQLNNWSSKVYANCDTVTLKNIIFPLAKFFREIDEKISVKALTNFYQNHCHTVTDYVNN